MLTLNKNGFVKERESTTKEYKRSFNKKLIPKYLRTLVAMANNKGGSIYFGINDSPHQVIGLENDYFEKIDPSEIVEQYNKYFSPYNEIEKNTFSLSDKNIGMLSIKESQGKPIICKNNSNECNLRLGAIYYRYSAKTQEIEYSELVKIIAQEREKEKKFWIDHISKISKIGPSNVSILDLEHGDFNIKNERIILNKELLKNIKLIKEGEFVEKKGSPALVIKGELHPADMEYTLVAPEQLYPLFTKDLQEELKLNQFELRALLWKFKIKGDKDFHLEIKSSRTNKIQKYSKQTIDFLTKKIESLEISTVKKEFSNYQKSITKNNE